MFSSPTLFLVAPYSIIILTGIYPPPKRQGLKAKEINFLTSPPANFHDSSSKWNINIEGHPEYAIKPLWRHINRQKRDEKFLQDSYKNWLHDSGQSVLGSWESFLLAFQSTYDVYPVFCLLHIPMTKLVSSLITAPVVISPPYIPCFLSFLVIPQVPSMPASTNLHNE